MNGSTKTISNLGEQKLKMLIKETVRESIKVEVMRLRSVLVPFISDKEQKEIERLYDQPSREYGKTYKLNV